MDAIGLAVDPDIRQRYIACHIEPAILGQQLQEVGIDGISLFGRSRRHEQFGLVGYAHIRIGQGRLKAFVGGKRGHQTLHHRVDTFLHALLKGEPIKSLGISPWYESFVHRSVQFCFSISSSRLSTRRL